MKPKIRMALLVTAVMVAACGSQPATRGSATTLPTHPPAGIIAEFPLPTSEISPAGITAGPDGNLWFTASTAVGDISRIGRITPAGQISEFALPPGIPLEIVAGPDGNLWFTEEFGKLGRVTPAGQLTEFPLPMTSGYPDSIAVGPDGNLWFTENPGNQIGRMTPAGQLTEFPLPNPKSIPNEITAGPDGNLWFTEYVDSGGRFTGNQIGRMTPTGQLTEFPLSTPGSSPAGITAGPDGNLWFTECSIPASGGACNDSRIGRITPAGQISEFALPRPTSTPYRITAGPDGNLWFAEEHPGAIGRITSGKGGS
jgi:virginiamycin B lyase